MQGAPCLNCKKLAKDCMSPMSIEMAGVRGKPRIDPIQTYRDTQSTEELTRMYFKVQVVLKA